MNANYSTGGMLETNQNAIYSIAGMLETTLNAIITLLQVCWKPYQNARRKRKPPGKGMPTPGNHEVGTVAPGDPTGALNRIFSQASSSPPCSRTVPWS